MIALRTVAEADFEAIRQIFDEIVVAGETYPDDETLTAEQVHEMWLGDGVSTVVATIDERVAGAYRLTPNMPGRGSHVANGSYIVAAGERGRGIGRLLVEHSLREAKRRGYAAMQFNFVVSTNRAAVWLYETCGFQTLATLPKAFHHRTRGFVDAYLMHRLLEADESPPAERGTKAVEP